MDEQKKKAYDEAIHKIEKEFGVFLLTFKSKESRAEAFEEINLARRFKIGVLSTPSVNHLPA